MEKINEAKKLGWTTRVGREGRIPECQNLAGKRVGIAGEDFVTKKGDLRLTKKALIRSDNQTVVIELFDLTKVSEMLCFIDCGNQNVIKIDKDGGEFLQDTILDPGAADTSHPPLPVSNAESYC